MENNAVEKKSKDLSEVNLTENSSKDGNKQIDQPKSTAQIEQINKSSKVTTSTFDSSSNHLQVYVITTLCGVKWFYQHKPSSNAKTDHWNGTSYKKLSKSCEEKLPPLIRKNSSDGLFLSHSLSSKTLTENSYPPENKKRSKTFRTIDIMKIQEGNLKPDETKDTGMYSGPNIPETANNAGLPSLSAHAPSFDSSKARLFRRGSLEVARESIAQKPGIFHLSIEKPDTKSTTDHPQPSITRSKDETLTHEGGNTDLPRPCQSGLRTSHNFSSKCGHLRSSSSLAFSYNSSSGSSSSSSLSSPHESYLSQSLNSGQYREKQLRKNTQNLKNCLSQEDISKISCPLQPHQEQRRIILNCSLGTSPQSLAPNIKGHSGSESHYASFQKLKSLPGSLEICHEKTNLKHRDSNISLDKDKTPKVLVSEKEPGSTENTQLSESVEPYSVTKKGKASSKKLKSLPGSLQIYHEKTNLKRRDFNISLDKEASPKVLVSGEEPGSTENTQLSESGEQDSVTKKDPCDKPGLIKPELTEFFSKNIRSHINSPNQTDSPESAKGSCNQLKMHRSTTVAKIENLSSQNETQRQILLTLQKRTNYQMSVSNLRPKDVGVCISSATMHKRRERNVTKQFHINKGFVFETKIPESRKPLLSEVPKRHKVRMAPNGENKPLLDILAQRNERVSVTKLDSCVKIEDMFENLRERKNEQNLCNKAANKQSAAVDPPNRILKNVSGPKVIGSKPNEKQELKRGNKCSNQKRSNEKDAKSQKTSRKQQIKSKRKKTPQFPVRSTSEEDLHSKLSSNVALISGPDWHIVTDCIDMSNVKIVNDSDIYPDYTVYVKGQQSDDNPSDPIGRKKNETSRMINDFCSDFLTDLINDEEKDNNLSHLTGNIQNSNSSQEKLASVNEFPETLKTDDLLKNNDLKNTTLCSFDDEDSKHLSVLPEDLSVEDSNLECTDFNKRLSQSEDGVLENPNIKMTDTDSEYETDFECLSVCGSDCFENEESLCDKDVDLDPPVGSPETKPTEVNQENLDSVVEELLNYSTSPVYLENRLSNISLPESDSILLRSLKHHKDSPFYAQNKSEENSVGDEGITNEVKENVQVSLTRNSLHKGMTSQVPRRHGGIDEYFLDKETESLSQLEDLNTKRDNLCRRDSTSTTSSFLSIGEDFSWKKGDLLGSGAYGRVWRGLTSDGEQIAVKQIVLDMTDREKAEREYQKVQEEVEILKTLQHKNIVSFLGMRREGEEVSIFMQYVTGGSIAQLLARFGPLDEPVFCSYTQQILEGVKYLHDKNVIHRDIKGGNVMLMPNSTIKLVDFGCAKRLCYSLNRNSLCNPTSLQGTPYWMAPEVIQETGHGKKSDIWSIGCTVFEMGTKNPPWSNMNPYAAIIAICSSKPVPCLPSGFSQKAQDFVRVCLIRDPTKRLTARELLQDKFITTPHHDRRRKSVTCFN